MKVHKANRKCVLDRINADPTFVKESIIVMKGGVIEARHETGTKENN